MFLRGVGGGDLEISVKVTFLVGKIDMRGFPNKKIIIDSASIRTNQPTRSIYVNDYPDSVPSIQNKSSSPFLSLDMFLACS